MASVYETSRWTGARELGGAIGLHKQIANRVVEPWMFITVIVTATEWGNFFALRDHADAQPELAACVTKAHKPLQGARAAEAPGGTVAPAVRDGQRREGPARVPYEARCFISAGRCARVSYLTHDGKRDPEADITLAKERILPSGHMSPFEHVAQAMAGMSGVSTQRSSLTRGRMTVCHPVTSGVGASFERRSRTSTTSACWG